MISTTEASNFVLSTSIHFGVEQVPFHDAVGRILAEDLFADRDFPPFDRVCMDGIALLFHEYENGVKTFPIESIAAAGQKQAVLNSSKNCIEVMTGAPLPTNCDTIIRYEDLSIENSVARVIDGAVVKKAQCLHFKGSDKLKGAIVLERGIKIAAPEISIAATLGKAMLSVYKNPKIAVISTGNELVEVSATPLPYQIRKSNQHQIQAQLKSWGLNSSAYHLTDNLESILKSLDKLIDEFDVLLLSGGVSKGKYDFIPSAFEKLGVKTLFHGVAQRPGKPFLFAEKKNCCSIFAFPGNPVSSFVGCLHYFYPWWQKSLGQDFNFNLNAELIEDFNFTPRLTYFLPVKTTINSEAKLIAKPYMGNGSGDLANLSNADGFLKLDANTNHFTKGSIFTYIPFR